jgi:hypothetical protein
MIPLASIGRRPRSSAIDLLWRLSRGLAAVLPDPELDDPANEIVRDRLAERELDRAFPALVQAEELDAIFEASTVFAKPAPARHPHSTNPEIGVATPTGGVVRVGVIGAEPIVASREQATREPVGASGGAQ